ncbi:MAG: type IV pilus modification protein PilV, partial [Gammaproteobacteria bacterium]
MKFSEKKIRGFTLLEVLIATVVLSIGLIGLAALMIQGQKFNRSALNRSQATFIAYDMADRMRANRAG